MLSEEYMGLLSSLDDMHKAQIQKTKAIMSNPNLVMYESEAVRELKNIERDYYGLCESYIFSKCNSIQDAIKNCEFTCIGSEKVFRDGRYVEVERVPKRMVIDLRKFCEVKGLDVHWCYFAEEFYYIYLRNVAHDFSPELGVRSPKSRYPDYIQKIWDALDIGMGRFNSYDSFFLETRVMDNGRTFFKKYGDRIVFRNHSSYSKKRFFDTLTLIFKAHLSLNGEPITFVR